MYFLLHSKRVFNTAICARLCSPTERANQDSDTQQEDVDAQTISAVSFPERIPIR